MRFGTGFKNIFQRALMLSFQIQKSSITFWIPTSEIPASNHNEFLSRSDIESYNEHVVPTMIRNTGTDDHYQVAICCSWVQSLPYQDNWVPLRRSNVSETLHEKTRFITSIASYDFLPLADEVQSRKRSQDEESGIFFSYDVVNRNYCMPPAVLTNSFDLCPFPLLLLCSMFLHL